MKKKLLSIILSVMVAFSMIPAFTGTALAADSPSSVKKAVNETKLKNVKAAWIFNGFYMYWDITDCKYKLDGYKIYMADSEDGEYTKVGETGQKEWREELLDLENGKTFYFKIKGYKKYKGKTYYTKTKKITYNATVPLPLTYDVKETSMKNVDVALKTSKEYNYAGTRRCNFGIFNPYTGECKKSFSVPVPDYSEVHVKELFADGKYSAYQISDGYDQWTNIIYDSLKNTVKTFASSYYSFEAVSDWMIIGKTYSGDGMGPQSISVFNPDGTYQKKNLVKSNWQPYAFGYHPKRVFYAVTDKASQYQWDNKKYTVYCYDSATGKSEKLASITATYIDFIGYDGIRYTKGTSNQMQTYKWKLDWEF